MSLEYESNKNGREIPPDLAQIILKKELLREKALKEFTEKKNKEGIDVDEALKKNDIDLIIELSRYQSEYRAKNLYGSLPNDVRFELIDANGVSAEFIKNPNIKEHQVFMHLFSGGYVMGTLETRRIIPFLIGRATKIAGLNVGYRLAPEFPFPSALDDAIQVYRWLLSKEYKPEKIIITGASAGGGLAIATVLKLQEMNIPKPAALVLLSPWVDLEIKGETMEKNAKFESNITREMLKMLADTYLQEEDPKNPLVNPLYADLNGLPPILIQAGSHEVLLDDSIRLAKHAKASGVEVTLEIYEGMIHVFQNLANYLSDSRKAVQSISKFIQNNLK